MTLRLSWCLPALAVIAIASCSPAPPVVQVIAEPVETNKRPLQEALPKDKNSDQAITHWFFHCSPDIGFDVVRSTPPSATTGNAKVTIKIRTVVMKIGLTIDEAFSPSPAAQTVRHEDGHAEICRRVYRSAPKAAESAARQAIGREFTATGKTVPIAQSAALENAQQSVCMPYNQNVNGLASKLSAVYEIITGNGHATIDSMKAVDEVFSEKKYYQ